MKPGLDDQGNEATHVAVAVEHEEHVMFIAELPVLAVNGHYMVTVYLGRKQHAILETEICAEIERVKFHLLLFN